MSSITVTHDEYEYLYFKTIQTKLFIWPVCHATQNVRNNTYYIIYECRKAAERELQHGDSSG